MYSAFYYCYCDTFTIIYFITIIVYAKLEEKIFNLEENGQLFFKTLFIPQ